MSLLKKLTIKNLNLNRKRTIVTIIGIILATALITAVSGMVSSFRETMINYEKEGTGNYHYLYENVDVSNIKYIKNNRNIKEYFITQNIGYAKFEKSKNEYKPYMYILASDKRLFNNHVVKLIDGRIPENSNEIVISEHINTNGGADYKVGDEITLDVGKRVLDGHELNQSNSYNLLLDDNYHDEQNHENIQVKYSKKYKIVGIIERPSYDMEERSAPGYTVITYMDSENVAEKANVYTLYENLDKQYETTAQILNTNKDIVEKYYENSEMSLEENKKTSELFNNVKKNVGLIRWEKLEFSDSNISMMYSVGTVVILIIIVTSVFCIRNSFAISITEKTKQYGMLISIGATAKQIKKNVLYEATILAVIGIPIGIISGIFADFVLIKIIGCILSESLDGINFVLKISWISIFLAMLLSIITIYFSAKSSARRASKISPIEAIRGTQDIKIKAKKLKTPKFVKKLFGIGGEISLKNLKRSRKKYRTTVISIVVSVAIFIAMSSFIGYAFDFSGIYYQERQYNMSIHSENKEAYEILQEVAKMKLVERYSLIREEIVAFPKDEVKYTDDAKEAYKYLFEENEENDQKENNNIFFMTIVSLGKQEYENYIKKLGLKYDFAKNKAILINNGREYDVSDDGKGKYKFFDLYEYKVGTILNGTLPDRKTNSIDNGEKISIEICKITDERPLGLEYFYSNQGMLVVSDEFIDKNDSQIYDARLNIKSNDSFKLEDEINKEYLNKVYVNNYDESTRAEKSLWIVISIFLYGFITVISLIGITNIFNTITTNMNLRAKEFANLKSVGMTKKEFNKMILLESIFYGFKSLLFGIPIGIMLSYFIYKGMLESVEMKYVLPIKAIIISILVVAVLIGTIMRYSLNKINKQNIIETIRKDNI